jgi:uncharacterized protein
MKVKRIVLDTNVIISALILPKSLTRMAFDLALENFEVLMSHEVLAELSEVIYRRRFDRYVQLSNRELFIAKLIAEVEFIEIKEAIAICRDPKDDKFLELVVSGNADFLITGDRDLLILNPFRDTAIISIQDFLETVVPMV